MDGTPHSPLGLLFSSWLGGTGLLEPTGVDALPVCAAGVAGGLRVVVGRPCVPCCGRCGRCGPGGRPGLLVVVVVVVLVFVVVLRVVVGGLVGGRRLGRNVMMGTRVGRGLNSDQKVVMPGGRNVGGHRVAVTTTLATVGVLLGACAVVLVITGLLVDDDEDVVLGLAEGLYVLLVVEGLLVMVGVGEVGVK